MDENTDPITHLDDLAVGSTRMATVEGRRVCLARTPDGVHAVDDACPHMGYGLTRGSLDGDLLTCRWHNWKFRVTDGTCVQGEEDVAVHHVDVDDEGAVRVRLHRPDPVELRSRLTTSLRRGVHEDRRGQIARDVVRLLRADANPGELVWEAIAFGAPRGEFGWGHSIATATDCLAMLELHDGDQRALPVVQAIAGVAETERDRPVRPLPDPAPAGDPSVGAAGFRAAIEAEATAEAQAIVLAAIHRGDDADELRRWFAGAVADHHLSYGHAAIYAHKAFELLDALGWDRADTVLGHLVPAIVTGTREDTLPYMRPFTRELDRVDLAGLADLEPDSSWSDDGALVATLLGSDRSATVAAVAAAMRDGAGVDGVLDAVVDATSERMLRYDTDGEFDFGDDFGWLDITHGITYAEAVRAHHRAVGHVGSLRPDLVRLVMFTAFLAQWTGRHEWHTSVRERHEVAALGSTVIDYGDELQRRSLLDPASSPIVHAHVVKTSRAAALEASRRATTAPLDAAARFMAAPKLERFVAATVQRSIEAVDGVVGAR
ncbi:Rieske (2Fe-2S) protein [Ilumatobacter sp.]|uniref:Rieske (2Fe-2S) protein n=1 Tax=Ilumatobacter sp. TaxID=1967498 RepID=UPI003B51BEC4